MLEDDMKQQLAAYLERLTQPVEITAFVDDGKDSRDMLELLADVLACSPQLRLREVREAPSERVPSFALGTPGVAPRVRFAGLPMGHEFTSLVLALLQVGGYPPKVEPQVIEQIRALDGNYNFETYISLSCQNCPDVVQALNLMSVVNPRIRHTMIDGAVFEQEVASKNIRSVPAVYCNGEAFGQGRMDVEQILAKLDKGSEARAAAQMAQQAPYDVLIVGGGPAGAAAAIYAARKGIRVGVAAERFGGQVLDTMGIENLISVPHTEGPQLAAALEQNVRANEAQIMNLQRAEQLIAGNGLTEVRFANGATLKAKSVILSTGARWREMNVPGEKEYRNRGVAYCPHCDGPLFKGKDVAVIGGGNSGVEAAIDLAGLVKYVTLIEFDSQLRADAVLVNKLKSLPNTHIITSAQTTEVLGNGQQVTGLTYRDRNSGEIHTLALEGVFVQIGLVPNTEWLKGTIALSPRGEIEIDAHGRTSLPGVFAAGDCTTIPYKQIVTAMGAGSKAALSAFDYLIRVPVAAAAAA
ncbi:MAG: alkyl hydroperoxide reductase subunit F [Steroidobacteraceae bacterium]